MLLIIMTAINHPITCGPNIQNIFALNVSVAPEVMMKSGLVKSLNFRPINDPRAVNGGAQIMIAAPSQNPISAASLSGLNALKVIIAT